MKDVSVLYHCNTLWWWELHEQSKLITSSLNTCIKKLCVIHTNITSW